MSLSLGTKGVIVNQVVSLATKGVIWRRLGEVIVTLVEFRARVRDVASMVGSPSDRATILATLSDSGANVSVVVTSSGIVATLTDRGNSVIITDTNSISSILDGYSTLVTAISDSGTLTILSDYGVFSRTTAAPESTRVTDASGSSEVRDL